MRTVSFVEKLQFEFPGSLFNQALALGDVDNDLTNELVVGNIQGDLAVFKGKDFKPWRTCSDLGMITCVGIGDVCNKGKNFLITLSAEGWCYLFDLSESSTAGADCDGDPRVMKPLHKQHLPANSKVMLLADVDDDNEQELVIGYSDRVVRSFRWLESGEPELKAGEFEDLEKWQLAGQIGSITVNRKADGKMALMVAQPGGTYVSLIGTEENNGKSSRDEDDESECTGGPSLIYHPLGSSRLRNNSVSTEIVGNISSSKRDQGQSSYFAVCTLDGTLLLVENEEILWSLQVDHQLFALTKHDVTGDGTEEAIVCSWDGQTYIVNHSKEVVRFQFEENVAAFCAGEYAVCNGENVPCLVYATFTNQVIVYYSIRMPRVQSSNLIQHMKENHPKIQDLMAYLNLDSSHPGQTQQFYHWCLYGNHPKTTEKSPSKKEVEPKTPTS